MAVQVVREKLLARAGADLLCAGGFGLDLERRQRAVEDAKLVDPAAFESRVAEARAEHQLDLGRFHVPPFLAVHDFLVKVVAHDLGRHRTAVAVEAQPGGAARSVVGHGQVGPLVERQRVPGSDREGVARPEVDE